MFKVMLGFYRKRFATSPKFRLTLISGVTADFVDRKAQDFIVSSGAYPSGVNFHGYPRAICVSVNEGNFL